MNPPPPYVWKDLREDQEGVVSKKVWRLQGRSKIKNNRRKDKASVKK